jgi:hypothetical protein
MPQQRIRKADWYLEVDRDRTKVCLAASRFGQDLEVNIYNDNIHLGAVAVSQFDPKTGRVSTSVITVMGHKDDAIARQAAYLICKQTKRPVCVLAGIHVDNISDEEIAVILSNVDNLVEKFIKSIAV